MTSRIKNKVVLEKQEALIYCGPHLKGGLLNQFTIYKNGFPIHLVKHLEQCPAIKNLFVPIAEMVDTIQLTSEQGSAQHVWFQEISNYKGSEI
ncbi:hypothetical protein EHS13_13765 [Paenibacillus psychroresistens]|uniref:Uncharacterized protein n=1 Tax=Paenibacillus psychroresistens TaxID=1778678 RepID=A0A6B8RKC2_9BACL|nr:hypothetical protein [Paenibacillus psychroresistens]QGQ95866.1 hypothetical protein EHS13_13765 [Paenibacillus psychroresistens]